MHSVANRLRRVLLAAPLLFLGACSHEDVVVSQPEIRVAPQADRRLTALHRVMADGKHAGWLRTFEVAGEGKPHTIHQVCDVNQNRLGYVDDVGHAYRLTAHDGTELVAESSDLRKNVAGILGSFAIKVDLIDESPK